MSRPKSMISIAASCSMVVASAVAWAQAEDRDACVDACREAKAQCIDICDTHDDPVQCDEACQETAENCIWGCR